MATKYARATGNWTTDATWSTTSGGPADTTKPTAADDAVLDAASGAINVTIDSGAVCRSLDCGGYTGTLTHTASVPLTIGDGTAGTGNRALRLDAGMTYTVGNADSTLYFISGAVATQTVTLAGKSIGAFKVQVGPSAVIQLADAMTGSGYLDFESGTFDTNSQTISMLVFRTTSTSVRTLTLGSSAITLSSTSTAWNYATVTNLTVTANTATATLSGAAATFSGGAKDWNGMSVVMSGSGAQNVTAGGTFANFTRTGTAVKTDSLTLTTSGITCTGTCTLTGNSAANRILVASAVLGTARTITAAAVSLTNVDFRDITGAGAATWSGTSVKNALGNSNITFDAPVTRYAVATGNVSGSIWSATSGGASGASVPTCQDTIVLNAASGAITVTNDMPRMCADLTCTGFTGTLASSATTEVYGSVTAGSGMTISGTGILTLMGRSSHTITSSGKTWTMRQGIWAGTYTLTDAWASSASSSNAVEVIAPGAFNDGGFSMTLTGSTAAIIIYSGTVTMSGTTTIASTTAPIPFTGAGTLNHTGTIILSGATATDRTFAGGGQTYGTLTDQNTSTGKLTITGANTFGTLSKTAAAACTLALPTSSGITVTGQFNVQGTSTATLTLTGDVTKASGVVECEYMSISSSDATGGARFYAPGGTDGGSNTGWIFAAAPSGSSSSPGRTGIVFHLNRLAGTDGLEMAGAANAWAGTSGLEVVGALNARLTQVRSTHPGGLELNGVCRELARVLGGDPVWDAPAALASIPT